MADNTMSDNEEENNRSLYGYSTEEIVAYWKNLKPGILAYPAPLKTQCLLFIVGHMLNPHYDCSTDKGLIQPLFRNMHLLPRSIRRQLLLLLPAIDVCRLEGTQMTKDIPMDEIWEVLFKERFEYIYDEEILSELGIMSPEELECKKQISCSWKDVYFNGVFTHQLAHKHYYEQAGTGKCSCVYRHFLRELLFGVYSVHGEIEVYQCFSKEKTYSCHGVCRCAHICPRLTPQRYSDQFFSPGGPERERGHSIMSLYSVVDILVTICKSTLHHFFLPHFFLPSTPPCMELWPYMNSLEFMKKLSSLLSSVQSIHISRLVSVDKAAKKISDIVFFSERNCVVKYAVVNDTQSHYHQAHDEQTGSIISMVRPYLVNSGNCMLKQLEIHVDTATKYETDVIGILEHHQSLEEVTFHFSSPNFAYNVFIQSTADLLYRSVFKKLTINICPPVMEDISPDVLFVLLRQFLASPHPVSLFFKFFYCSKFDALISPFDLNTEQQSKSLELDFCTFSLNLSSLFPTNLVFDTLNLERMDHNTLCSFANMESIKVHRFTLSFQDMITNDNINDVCKLISIVTAQEWNLDILINETSPVDPLLSSMSQFAHLIRRIYLPMDLSLTILETVFNALPCSKPPNFKLGFSLLFLNEEVIKEMYALWEKCGSIKLKSIRLFDKSEEEPIPFENLLSEMALSIEINDFW